MYVKKIFEFDVYILYRNRLPTYFECFFTRIWRPSALLETTIVPVIKNKCGSLTDCNNYRPIAIATITSKHSFCNFFRC